MLRTEIEAALSDGNLWAKMANGRFWRCRRNGATKLWKRDPSRFEIPVKAGLKACGRVSNENCVVKFKGMDRGINPDFVISESDPNG